MEGVISTVDPSATGLVEKARSSPGLIGRDLVKEVTCTEPFRWWQGEWRWPHGYLDDGRPTTARLSSTLRASTVNSAEPLRPEGSSPKSDNRRPETTDHRPCVSLLPSAVSRLWSPV